MWNRPTRESEGEATVVASSFVDARPTWRQCRNGKNLGQSAMIAMVVPAGGCAGQANFAAREAAPPVSLERGTPCAGSQGHVLLTDKLPIGWHSFCNVGGSPAVGDSSQVSGEPPELRVAAHLLSLAKVFL